MSTLIGIKNDTIDMLVFIYLLFDVAIIIYILAAISIEYIFKSGELLPQLNKFKIWLYSKVNNIILYYIALFSIIVSVIVFGGFIIPLTMIFFVAIGCYGAVKGTIVVCSNIFTPPAPLLPTYNDALIQPPPNTPQ